MSSYDIKHGDYLVFIGWDRPLDTFFATIERLDDTGMEEPDMMLGTEPGEYRDVKSFQRSLSAALLKRDIPDIILSEELVTRLQADYDENPPGTGQQDKTPAMQDFNQWWLHSGRDAAE